MYACRLQPTWRHCRSSTAARYSHPSSVAMYVMSPLHTTLGAAGMKRRCTRSGATGKRCTLSVVYPELAPTLGPDAVALHQPARPLFAHAQAAGQQFAMHARPPYSPRNCSWMARM